jgi:hypothetical protein
MGRYTLEQTVFLVESVSENFDVNFVMEFATGKQFTIS